MRFLLFVLLIGHGLIHLLGFAKATRPGPIHLMAGGIAESAAILWLFATALFVIAGFVLLQSDSWWTIAAPAVGLSLMLVASSWREAKYGVIPNLIVFAGMIPFIADSSPESLSNRYAAAVREGFERSGPASLLEEQDVIHLPLPVQRYLRYAGAIGKPRVRSLRALFQGTIRGSRAGEWMRMTAEQYNFFEEPRRVFFIRASRFGVPFDGLHLFRGPAATMEVRVASLIPVVDARGPEMNRSETVTLFNDMCLLAPATLIDPRIEWEPIDGLTARAAFTNQGITIRARLHFNEAGELVDFDSEDRFQTDDGKTYRNYRWSTPVRNYREIEGRRIWTEGDAIWHAPGGEFAYGRFVLDSITYNQAMPAGRMDPR